MYYHIGIISWDLGAKKFSSAAGTLLNQFNKRLCVLRRWFAYVLLKPITDVITIYNGHDYLFVI